MYCGKSTLVRVSNAVYCCINGVFSELRHDSAMKTPFIQQYTALDTLSNELLIVVNVQFLCFFSSPICPPSRFSRRHSKFVLSQSLTPFITFEYRHP